MNSSQDPSIAFLHNLITLVHMLHFVIKACHAVRIAPTPQTRDLAMTTANMLHNQVVFLHDIIGQVPPVTNPDLDQWISAYNVATVVEAELLDRTETADALASMVLSR